MMSYNPDPKLSVEEAVKDVIKVAQKEHYIERNIDETTGKFLCSDPKLNEIKIRLYDKDRQCTKEYTLSKLIYTKFKRNKFEYRGVSTGLKDKNGNLIYEGDVVEITIFGSVGPNGGYVDSDEIYKGTVVWERDCFLAKTDTDTILFPHSEDCIEIVGNIHEQAEQKD